MLLKQMALIFSWLALLSVCLTTGCGEDSEDENDAVDDDDESESEDDDSGSGPEQAFDDDDATDDDVSDDDATDDDDTTTDDDADDDAAADDDTADDDDDTGPCEPRLHVYDGFESYSLGLWNNHGDWLLYNDQVNIEKIRLFDTSRGLKALHMGGLFASGMSGSKYIWQEMVGYDLPGDTCDVFWIEIDGKTWTTPGDGGIGACISHRFYYPENDTFCAATDIRLFWTNLKLRVDKVNMTVETYVDDQLQDTYVMEGDYPVFMFYGASVWGGYVSPHIAMDEFYIYDDGYEP